MIELLQFIYPWIKWLHILAVISWMAGLLYLPRLFVYHAETPAPESKPMLEVMEARLMKVIMGPAMAVTWISGLMLSFAAIDWSAERWIFLKLLCVIAMTGFHMHCNRWRKELADGHSIRTGRFFRLINEVPTVLMVVIVGLVIFKPF